MGLGSALTMGGWGPTWRDKVLHEVEPRHVS
jgi:hypothetical protein